MTKHSSGFLAALVLASAVAVGACSGQQEPPPLPTDATVQLTADLAGTPVSTLVVTVSAADLEPALSFNLEVVDGTATGTLRVPAGAARTFLVRAFDSTGEVTHEGSATLAVRAGPNPPLAIQLVPRPGQVPVTVTVGSVTVAVAPTSVTLDAGTTVQLAATVQNPDGSAVADAGVAWATLDPSVATVSASGLVTGRAAGTAQVVASYNGVAASCAVTVAGAVCTPQAEVCDGQDNDCDGTPDDALSRSCYSGPAGSAGVGRCRAGTQACGGGAWGTCQGEVTPIEEVCSNGLDDDCDGTTDVDCNVCSQPCPLEGQCNTSTCDPRVGCMYASVPDGTACNENGGTVCRSGSCVVP